MFISRLPERSQKPIELKTTT